MTTTLHDTVRSADGTTIAFERSGVGPALILVEPAAHYRAFSAFAGLVELLTPHFTVYRYDRRGRGGSTDTLPYTPEREVEDLAALVEHADGSAFVYGFSSGGLLSLQAVAGGLAIPRLAVFEPPLQEEGGRADGVAFAAELAELAVAGRRSDAVERFQTGIGVPAEIVEASRDTPAWAAMESVAHTLAYDGEVSNAMSPEVLGSVTVPTLVLDSEGSSDNLTGWAATVAAKLPNASHHSLAGEWHGVADGILAPVLIEHFTSELPRAGGSQMTAKPHRDRSFGYRQG